MNGNENTSRNSYGILITPDAKMHRKWFLEFTRLHGKRALYECPINKKYNQVGELECDYGSPIEVGCIYEERPTQKTTRLLGWNSQLQEEASLIHLPYETENLERGGRVIVPSAFDETKGQVFRIITMSAVGDIFPYAISCAIVPVFENKFDQGQFDYTNSTLNLLFEEEDD